MEFTTEELRLIDTSLGLLGADLQLLQHNLPNVCPESHGDFAEEDLRAQAKLGEKLSAVRELRIRLRADGGSL